MKSDSFFDLTIQCDAGTFLGQISRDRFGDLEEWGEYLQTLRTKYSLDEIYNWDFVDTQGQSILSSSRDRWASSSRQCEMCDGHGHKLYLHSPGVALGR